MWMGVEFVFVFGGMGSQRWSSVGGRVRRESAWMKGDGRTLGWKCVGLESKLISLGISLTELVGGASSSANFWRCRLFHGLGR